jgi:hypothetical protein
LTALLAACGGFLVAVVWMDLIFDVQVLRHARASGPLPEPVLASIAGYYRRATTDSRPMSRLIAAAMGVAVLGSLYRLVAGDGSLAHSICRDHLLCLASIGAFTLLQVVAAGGVDAADVNVAVD